MLRPVALGVAKSWQAQGIRTFADVSLKGCFLDVRHCAVERSSRL